MSREDMNNERLMVLSNVTKVYLMGDTQVQALRGVNLQIKAREFIAVLGPSGSGKSTIMHVLGCLDTPTSGTYHLDGVAVQDLGRNELAEMSNFPWFLQESTPPIGKLVPNMFLSRLA
jgi:putative ABC transport system ATP-binding protein